MTPSELRNVDRRIVVMLDVISEHPAGIRPIEWWKEARKRLEKEGIALSREVFYRNVRYLMKKYVAKIESKRNYAVYTLKENPLKALVKDFQELKENIRKYMMLVEDKERKGEINREEAMNYIVDAWKFMNYIIMRTIALAEQYPEDEDAFYQLAGKTIREIGAILHPFIARDEYEKRFKEKLLKEVVEKEFEDKELEKYSPSCKIRKFVAEMLGVAEKKIDVRKAIKVIKISAKIEKV